MAMNKQLASDEAALVSAVHTALRQRFAQIAGENEGRRQAMRNRMKGEREKWRLAFANAKTRSQVRFALADLWSRAGSVKELQASWEIVLGIVQGPDWEAARDLALVALASYRKAPGEPELDAETAN